MKRYAVGVLCKENYFINLLIYQLFCRKGRIKR